MLDNADSFDKVGESIRVANNGGGDSGYVPLAKSNRLPDWYFFDLSKLKSGDEIVIIGKTKEADNIFTLGAIVFD